MGVGVEVGLRNFETGGAKPLMGTNAADSEHAKRWTIANSKEAGFIVWLRWLLGVVFTGSCCSVGLNVELKTESEENENAIL